MGKVIADLATSAASATFAVENATSSVDYVLSGTDGSANDHLKTDGSGNLAWVTPAGGLFSGYAIFADEKTAGTFGGSTTSGSWIQRDINTTITNTDTTNISLGTNEFTLLAGNYWIDLGSSFYDTQMCKCRLYDNTAGATVGVSPTQYASLSSYASQSSAWATISVRVTPSVTSTYRIEYRTDYSRATTGLGPAFASGEVERFLTCSIFKEA